MENKPVKKPLSFGATMLASALGVLIVSIVAGIVMMISLVAMVAMVGSMGKDDTVVVKNDTTLSIDLTHIVGDRTAGELEQTLSDGKTVGLVDGLEATRAIRAAATDARIRAIYLHNLGASNLGWGSLYELRSALADYGESGKKIVAYSADYSQGGYYLATVADSIFLHPAGMVDLRGIGAQVMYYKDALEKLGIEMQLIRPESCAYKSAGEVYTLNHMSSANREQLRTYLGSIWQTVRAQIAEARGQEVAQVDKMVDQLSAYLANDAKQMRMVDSLCFEQQVRQMLKESLASSHLMPIEKYCKQNTPSKMSANRVAIVYAEGNVMDGSARGMASGVYGDDIVKALQQATTDDKVKAIVLRINSPGGSAIASESMTYAVRQAREKKPVVVSMGDVAASAGYEMSCLANVIVAQPTTITGSIGVFGTVPSVEKLMRQKLGINVDTVATNRNATGLSPLRPLSPAAREMMMRNVEDFYRTFVGRVAEGRHMDYDAVHSIARGRVWMPSASAWWTRWADWIWHCALPPSRQGWTSIAPWTTPSRKTFGGS